jgi:hypothetical protein
MDCDKQFDQPRAIMDPRMKIMLDGDGKLSWRIQDMNPATARECARRIGLHMMMIDLYGAFPIRVGTSGPMIELTGHSNYGDQKAICVAHNVDSGAIQFSISGVDIFQATMMCESFVHYANAMIGDAFTIDETDSS